MRLILLAILLCLSCPASGSWYRSCLLTGELASEVRAAEQGPDDGEQVGFDFRITKAVALKGTYDSQECTRLEGTEVEAIIPKRSTIEELKPDQPYRLQQFFVETMCAGGGACSAQWYEVRTESEAKELVEKGS